MNTRQIPWPRIAAESAAIIASILLAFWIDAWWEGRQQSAPGAEYEDRIASELVGNLEQLHRLREQGLFEKLGRTEQAISAVEEAIALLD